MTIMKIVTMMSKNHGYDDDDDDDGDTDDEDDEMYCDDDGDADHEDEDSISFAIGGCLLPTEPTCFNMPRTT